MFSEINEEMKMAVATALAELTEQPVPAKVKSAFPADKDFRFGPEYIVPTPFDPRLLKTVAVATAKGKRFSNDRKFELKIQLLVKRAPQRSQFQTGTLTKHILTS